jgi:MFS family permease
MSVSYKATDASAVGFLNRERTIAKPGFNRWLVPPAALAIHLCIGMAYGLSVFWLPLTHLVGGAKPAACQGLAQSLVATSCDWRIDDVNWMFKLSIVVLGCSAALWGGWLERVGPRRAGVTAALCWSGGLAVTALGITLHQLWLMWLGTGVIGGIGLGLGYISPVSTLMKWFPDRRGMATGMAIMGFGGGAMIGAPLANLLMNALRGPGSAGIAETFLILAAIYLVFMLGGAIGYRVPTAGWQPPGQASATRSRSMVTTGHVDLRDAHRTPQFWLIWMALFLNVSAGIGVLAMSSPMLQEIFAGRLIGLPDVGFLQLDPAQRATVAGIAAGFTGLLSLFNIGGRFFWASFSDRIGRKLTFATFFALGVALYALAPWAAHAGSKALFVAVMCVILSMYGGGFATVPAYLADMFGTQFVGAIHGRLLTAWSAAGLVGPSIVGILRDNRIAAGVPRDQVYDQAMYVLAALLALGFVANLLVRPVARRWLVSDATARTERSGVPFDSSFGVGSGGISVKVLLAWTVIVLPLAWGVFKTMATALKLFG